MLSVAEVLNVRAVDALGLVFMLHPHKHGWRWAIYWATVEQAVQTPLERCVNAGFELDQGEADRRGQDCLYTVLGFQARTQRRAPEVFPITLQTDPLPDVALELQQVTDRVIQVGEA